MRLTYDGNGSTGGTVPTDSTDYNAGDYATVKAPGTMVKDGALFSGWKCRANNKTYHPRNKMMVYHPTVMEAQWAPDCVINYDTLNAVHIEGIRPFDRRRYYLGDKVTVPPHDDLTALQAIVGEGDGKLIEGYVSLQGWKIITGALSDRYILHAGDTFTVTGAMVVLQAVWAPSEITIAYEINGAEGDTPEIQTALSGRWTTLAEPTCTKEGYYFGGWGDMITGLVHSAGARAVFLGCTTLEAIWVPAVVYTVHYDANGASGGTPPADNRSWHGGSVPLPEISEQGGIYKTGYTFAGWVLREPEFALFMPCEDYSVTHDTTFYARWMPIDASDRRTVEYTSDETDVALEAEPPTDENDYVDGDFAFAATWSPLKIGRIVTGWQLGDTVYKFGDLVPVQGNITLTAVWETIPSITLKFRGGEGATGTVDDIIVDVTGTVMLPMASSFSRTGYFADGWIAPDGTKVASGALTTVNLDGETTELEYTVNWIDTAPEHTVTYLSVDHDSGHVPVDPCKYHAGDMIPLAPAGDLRKEGFELAGWEDVTTGKTYSIPSNEEIIAYCNASDRSDYDSVFPMMWCTDDHTLLAYWVPVARLFFGSKGATAGLPPDTMRVRYDDSVRIPDKGTLFKNGYTLVGWKDEITGTIYKVGDIYQCAAPEVLTLQPVFQTASIVEYIIPQGLLIANTAWMPKNGYCVNCHSKTVIVPPEMKGQYCWVRSDTGERITETCEIHDIYGDICLTLTPLSMSDDGDDRWVWSTHVTADGFTQMHGGTQRCGDYFEFPKNNGAGFSGWILNNDERRIYKPGEKVQIFGHAVLRAVYPNATHVVTFSYPEGTLAEEPAGVQAAEEGYLYQLPSGAGIRGPNGTKLLYWFGVDQTSTSDDPPIVRRWYPGEYLRVPVTRSDLDADAKMLNSSGQLVIYPQFGNKFHVGFEDPDGEIMPEGGFVADGVYAEMQAVRVPQVTKLEREEHTDAEWQAAWRIPYRAVDSTGANDYTYAGMFEAEEEEDPEGNGVLTFAACILYGWLFYLALKHNILFIGTVVKSSLQKMGLQSVLTTLEYEYDNTIAHERKSLPRGQKGFWFEPLKLVDVTQYLESDYLHPLGWMYVGGPGGTFSRLFGTQYQARMLANVGDSLTYGAPGTCKWRAAFAPRILAYYNLADSIRGFRALGAITRTEYVKALNPRWVKRNRVAELIRHQPSYASQVKMLAGDDFDRPTLGTDFTYNNAPSGLLNTTPTACDRWYPRVFNEETQRYELNPYVIDEAAPESPTNPWLDAVGNKNLPGQTVGTIPQMPNPEDPNYAKYFKKQELTDAYGEVYHYHVIAFDLRWHRPETVLYTYFSTNGREVEQKGQYQSIKVTEGLSVAKHISKPIYVAGETPKVAANSSLTNMALYVKDAAGRTYGFSHWKIRPGSKMDKFYKENEIPTKPEYRHGDSLPYVRPAQPTLYLALDAEYVENHEPYDEGYDFDECFNTEDNPALSLMNQLERQARAAEYDKSLKSINAYKTYQQNQDNARQAAGGNANKKSNGIVDKVITGVKIFAAIASAAAAIFIGVTCLQHQKATLEAERTASGTGYTLQNAVHYIGESPTDIGTLNNNSFNDCQAAFNPFKKTTVVERIKEGFVDLFSGKGTVNQANKLAEAKNRYLGIEDPGGIFDGRDRLGAPNASAQSPASPSSIRAVYEKLSDAADAKENYEDFQKRIRRDQSLETAAITDTDEPYVTVKPLTKRLVTDDGDHVMLTDGVSACYGVMNVDAGEMQAHRDANAIGFNYFGIEVAEDFDGLGLAGTPSPHQLMKNAAEYAYIKYIPRDPDDPNWYVAGDTVPVDEEKVPVIVRYLTFTNEFDDNAPDSDTHTEPDEFREPHETFTVPECGAEAPTGMEFAGWILDENASTRSIVQPGDTIEQGPCNHVFKALWLPANPTRFPGLQNPIDKIPVPFEEALK